MPLASATAQLAGRRVYLHSAPAAEIEDDKYVVRFARNIEEVDAALKVRFEVFNLELGEGLDSSFQTGRDRDEFDATCHHLVVTCKNTNDVVGTYRVRTIEMARSAEGFYSAGEFDLTCLPPDVLNQSVELGRACIAQRHRNRQVLFLLWKGLALYAIARQKRFLFGCCSLTSQDESEGRELLDHFTRNGHMHPTFFVRPKPGFECGIYRPGAAQPEQVKVPRLFDTYLAVGAKVCSPPAIDRQFKTIDFFVVFDCQELDAKTRRLFFTT